MDRPEGERQGERSREVDVVVLLWSPRPRALGAGARLLSWEVPRRYLGTWFPVSRLALQFMKIGPPKLHSSPLTAPGE